MDEYKTKAVLIYEIIRNQINSGEYKPSDRLNLSQIAKDNNISYIPVREAMRMLEREGLVNIIPNVGPFVSEFEDSYVHEHCLIRGLLEGYAVRLSIDYLTDIDLNRLEQNIHEMELAVESEDYKLISELNQKFHMIIYDSIPQKELYKMIMASWQKLERTKSVFALNSKRADVSIKEHFEILKLIREKKYNEVEFLVREHKYKIADYLMKTEDDQKKIK